MVLIERRGDGAYLAILNHIQMRGQAEVENSFTGSPDEELDDEISALCARVVR